MKWAGAPLTLKPPVALNTTPVGAPTGMLTTSGGVIGMLLRTPPEYSVETSMPLSDTHAGVAGPKARPQG